MQKPVHNSLVLTLLTRETGNLIPALYDEIEHSVTNSGGAARRDARGVCLLFHANGALLDNGVAFAQNIPVASTLLKFVWRPCAPWQRF